MFSQLHLTNFRSFKDSGDVPLGRLNVLIGANSSGKSSFLYSLMLLKQTLEDPNLENVLVTDGRMVSMGGFADLAFGHTSFDGIGLSLTLDPAFVRENARVYPASMEDSKEAEKLAPSKIDLLFECNRRNKQFFLKNFSLTSRHGLNLIGGNCNANGKPKSVNSVLLPNLKPSSITLSHFLPNIWMKRSTNRTTFDLYRILSENRFIWEKAFKEAMHIGPVRSTIQMHYTVTGESPTSVGARGENLLAVLFQDQRLSSRRRKLLLAKLNKWLEGHFGFVKDIKLEPLTKGRNVYALTGLDPSTGVRVNLSQVGFGVSQTAPIIVQGFLSVPNSCLIIEQPEIHLHPAAQADLGDLFIDIIKDRKQLFVETHSEHLILRIRRRIAEGLIKPSDVRLLFVSKGKDGSKIEALEMDSRGQIINWPKGFFEEGYTESLKLVEAVSQSAD